MPSIFKRCELCEGVGTITLVDPITTKDLKHDICPLCRGSGGFNIHFDYAGNKSYDWRYRKKLDDIKGSGDNL